MKARVYVCLSYHVSTELQCNSDTNYLGLGQISQVKGSVLHRTPLPSDTSHKLWGSQATCTFDQLATNSGLCTLPWDSVICLNDSEDSGKHYIYDRGFIIKDTEQDQLNEEMHKVRSGKVPKTKLPCPQETSPSWHLNVYHQPGNSARLWCPEFLLDTNMQAWLIKLLVMWLNSVTNLLSLPGVRWLLGGLKPQPSNHMVGLSSLAIPHPETTYGPTMSHLNSINSSMVSEAIKSDIIKVSGEHESWLCEPKSQTEAKFEMMQLKSCLHLDQ